MYVDTDAIAARFDRVNDRNKVRAHFGRKTRRTLRREKGR